MQYLGTNELGFDAFALGFPSVKTCEAIVFQADFGLFGLHDAFGNTAAFPEKSKAFCQFVQEKSMDYANHALCIIGVITREHRFSKDNAADWRYQLVQVANELNFAGSIWAARIDSHVGNDDSAYIRFDRRPAAVNGGPPCKVSYKRWSKMEFAAERDYDQRFRRALKKDPDYRPTTLQEADAHPYLDGPAGEKDAPVVRKGRTDEGNLNQVTKFEQFR